MALQYTIPTAGRTAAQVRTKTASEVVGVDVSFSDLLASSESLTGSVTSAVSPSGPTLANEAVSTGALTIEGISVSTGRAVQLNVSGGTAGTLYTITLNCDTDASVAHTLYGTVVLEVISD